MRFRYADLQPLFHALLGFQDSEVFGADGARDGSGDRIQSRLKMFRREQFPASAASVTGPGAYYSFEDVLQLTLAMALMEERFAAKVVALLIKRHWDKRLRHGLVDAWRGLGVRDEALLLAISNTTFDGFGTSSTAKFWNWLPSDAPLAQTWPDPTRVEFVWSNSFVTSDLFKPRCTEPLPYGGYHSVVLNVSKLVDALGHLLPQLGLVTAQELAGWFDAG